MGQDTDLTALTLSQARDGLRAKEFSSREITQSFIDRMAASEKLNAYILQTPETALEAADQSDARIGADDARPMEGLPIGVKDLFCTNGVRTTACSNILGDFTPTYESKVTENLWADGALMLGKLYNVVLAMGSSNDTSAYGACLNPWRADDGEPLVPGGSSVALRRRWPRGSVWRDSYRYRRVYPPACRADGTVGLKPTYGRCSRWGIVAFASSLDQAGPITRTVRDSAIMLTSMAGHDARDTTSVDMAVPDYEAALTGDIRGLRMGVPKEYRIDTMPTEIEALWQQGMDWLRDAGAEIVDVSLPHTKYALPAYYIIAPAEASSNLARYDGVRYGARKMGDDIDGMYARTRGEGFGDEVQRRLLVGTYALSAGYYDAYYLKALQVRRLIAQDFENAYQNCDLLLTPTTPSAAFALDKGEADPLEMYLNDVFTVTVNLAGLPGISVPAGLDAKGLPLGLQLIGKAFGEEELLLAAKVLETAPAISSVPSEWGTKS